MMAFRRGGMTARRIPSLSWRLVSPRGKAEYEFGIVADLDLNSRDPQEFIWLPSCI